MVLNTNRVVAYIIKCGFTKKLHLCSRDFVKKIFYSIICSRNMSNTRTLRSKASTKVTLTTNDVLDETTKKKSPRKRKETKVSENVQDDDLKSKDNDASTSIKQIKLENKLVVKANKKNSISPRKKNVTHEETEVNTNDVLDKTTKKKSPRKRKETKASENVQDVDLESKDNDASTSIKLENKLVVKDNKKNSISPRKKKVTQEETDVKQKTVYDIENGGWKPDNWEQVWENILKMRKLYVAPVDSLGCEECPEKGVSPEIFRYQTLISVMLSSQTRDEVTHAATQRLIEHGLTVDNVLKTSDEKIGELIYPAGFWKSKVKYIKQTSQILKDQFNGDIPRTFKELCKLPGVGPKMANIVMSVGWNDTVGIAVDTHVHRISNRLGWVKKATKTPEETMKALESWLPKNLWRPVNVALVGFGQTICKPIGPCCEICFNNTICPSAEMKSPKKK